jgi:hypothetical protein
MARGMEFAIVLNHACGGSWQPLRKSQCDSADPESAESMKMWRDLKMTENSNSAAAIFSDEGAAKRGARSGCAPGAPRRYLLPRRALLAACCVCVFSAYGCENSQNDASLAFANEAAALSGVYRIDLRELRESDQYRALRALNDVRGRQAAKRLLESASQVRLTITKDSIKLADQNSRKELAYRIVAKNEDALLIELRGVRDEVDRIEVRTVAAGRIRIEGDRRFAGVLYERTAGDLPEPPEGTGP